MSAGFPALELRRFAVYGPREGEKRFIPTLMRAALAGAPLPLAPDAPRDFVYIEDVVNACLRAAAYPVESGSVLDIGSGVTHANHEAVELMGKVSRRPIPIAETPRPGSPSDCFHWCADISAARSAPGWTSFRRRRA